MVCDVSARDLEDVQLVRHVLLSRNVSDIPHARSTTRSSRTQVGLRWPEHPERMSKISVSSSGVLFSQESYIPRTHLTIVRDRRVAVLQVREHDKPVVCPLRISTISTKTHCQFAHHSRAKGQSTGSRRCESLSGTTMWQGRAACSRSRCPKR